MKWIYRHPRVYDWVDTVVSLSLSDRVRRRVLSGLRGDSLLEIGAGTGKNFRLVDSAIKIGVDRSVKMLAHAKMRFPGISVVKGDAHRLPFRDGSVDISVFCYCLRGLARPLEAVREALRVSAEVVIIDYHAPTFIPTLIWEKIVNRLGHAIFGSRDLDFTALERLGNSTEVTDLYGRLYRVVIMKGAVHAQD
jgi:ubiquinone/menaquinone biosynthesis C-methylase UbiE